MMRMSLFQRQIGAPAGASVLVAAALPFLRSHRDLLHGGAAVDTVE